MFPDDMVKEAKRVLAHCEERGWMLATAESCTGGLIAALITSIAGSSSVFERGFVTYSNEAKETMLNVPAALIKQHGAVSAEVAKAMAQGALARSRAQISLSVTGIAGPGGGTDAKPVGLVYIGMAAENISQAKEYRFSGSRNDIRLSAVKAALALIGSV